MSKVAVVYWSGTGNTEAMAKAVAEGIGEKGGEAALLTAAEFSADAMDGKTRRSLSSVHTDGETANG